MKQIICTADCIVRPHSACRERHTFEESPCCVKIKGATAPSFVFTIESYKFSLSRENKNENGLQR